MKTLNLLFASAILSLAMISCQKENIEPSYPVSGDASMKTTPSAQGEVKKNSPSGEAVNVRYEVNIHLTFERSLINTYEVILLDANERLVAPKQTFKVGKAVYNFYEQTRQSSGIRIAKLVTVTYPDEHFIAETELFTPPAVNYIEFAEGNTYTFDLIPQNIPSKRKD